MPLLMLRRADTIACASCERAIDLTAIAAGLPASLTLEESPRSAARVVSEFP